MTKDNGGSFILIHHRETSLAEYHEARNASDENLKGSEKTLHKCSYYSTGRSNDSLMVE